MTWMRKSRGANRKKAGMPKESDIPFATTSILPAEENFIIVAFHEPQVSPLTPLTILMTSVVFPGFQIFIFFVFAWEAFQQD